MVSYTGPDDRLFQGVLLDATKRSGTIDKCLFVYFILSHLTEAIFIHTTVDSNCVVCTFISSNCVSTFLPTLSLYLRQKLPFSLLVLL